MDGFDKTENIVVIGATNHEDNLDSASVRPGRFDKKIHIPKPDKEGRKDILELYLKKIVTDSSVEASKLAGMTPGFTGADLQNLVNTSISEAVHAGKTEATMADFEHSRDRILMGVERKSLTMSDRERLCTAIHESGHTIATLYTPQARQLYKVTIVARGGALGVTQTVPGEGD